jgi:hypothetical protein
MASFISTRMNSLSPICHIAESFRLSQPQLHHHQHSYRVQRTKRPQGDEKKPRKLEKPLILIPKEKVLYRPEYDLKYPRPREDLPQALIDYDRYQLQLDNKRTKLVPIDRPKFRGLVQEITKQVEDVHPYTESLKQKVDLEDLKELRAANLKLKRQLISAKRKARVSVR